MKSSQLGIAPHSLAKAMDTVLDHEDIVKLAKPGDYYQVMRNIGGGGGHRLNIEDFKIIIHFKPHFRQKI